MTRIYQETSRAGTCDHVSARVRRLGWLHCINGLNKRRDVVFRPYCLVLWVLLWVVIQNNLDAKVHFPVYVGSSTYKPSAEARESLATRALRRVDMGFSGSDPHIALSEA